MRRMTTSRRQFLHAAAALCAAAASAPLHAAARRRVLIVSTNVGTVGKDTSGTYLWEIAWPFQYFTEQGYEVDVVTPQGGKAAIYHVGNKRDDLAAIESSPAFREKTSSTLKPAAVNPALYAAVYYPGGHGQYFDVVEDQAIAAITAAIHRAGGVVGTAGHGVASLVNVKTVEGAYLVAGKRMTCFPTWGEKKYMNISGYGALLPFDMEQVLRARGADLVVCTEETRSDPAFTLITDEANRFVTGAWASGARPVAVEMARLLQKA